jgi:glycosyltransferase involved in cell wall biosynthesis
MKALRRQLISVILPVHNQADHIVAVLQGHLAQLKRLRLDHEVIVVANACSDDSAALCKRLARRQRNLKVLESKQGGWGLAVRLGLKAAKGQLLCYTNSSRTLPEDLAVMLAKSVASPDRVLKADRRLREAWLRKLGSALYNLECRLLLGTRTRDVNGTPKIFPRKFSALLRLQEPGDLIDAEFMAACRREAYPVEEHPLYSSRRHGGKSTTGWNSALRLYRGVLRLSSGRKRA